MVIPVKNQQMKLFPYCKPQSNKVSLSKKNKCSVYNTYLVLILHYKKIVTIDILYDWEVCNKLQDGGLLEAFWFDPEIQIALTLLT